MSNNNRNPRIGFGSCSSQHHDQIIWPAILARNLSAWIWGGDAIYADTKSAFTISKDPEVGQATPETLHKLYREQKTHPGYKSLLDTGIFVTGAIDDHDYGVNNGDRNYRYRKESGIEFACEFLDQKGTAMCDRAQKGMGVYAVKVLDFARAKGKELLTDEEAGLDPDAVPDIPQNSNKTRLSDKSVAIFILDVRSNRTPYIKKGFDSYDYNGDFLGDAQWSWFEEATKRSTAAINIVVQGLQVHADRVGTVEMEFWSNFPTSQHRLYQALLRDNVQNPILISGDVHQAMLLRKDCRPVDRNKQILERSKPLVELTTSGMTHAWGAKEHLCARPGSLEICEMWHMKMAGHIAMNVAYWINSRRVWTDLIDLSSLTDRQHITKGESKEGMQFALELNFGELEIDWEQQVITARILGKEAGAPPLLSSNWSFDFLSGGKAHGSSQFLQDAQFLEAYNQLEENGAIADDMNWVCANYRGTPSSFIAAIGFILPTFIFVSMSMLPFFLPVVVLIALAFRYRRRPNSSKKEKTF